MDQIGLNEFIRDALVQIAQGVHSANMELRKTKENQDEKTKAIDNCIIPEPD